MFAGRLVKGKGFTLVELLVVVVLLAVIATIAVPGFQRLMHANRVAADYNDIMASLRFARSEALERRREVEVVFSEESGVWEVEVVSDGVIVRRRSGRDAAIKVEATVSPVRFNSLGRSLGCSAGCVVTIEGGSSEILVSASGMIESRKKEG